MFCYKCGSNAKDGDKFCTQCGADLYQKPKIKTIKLTCAECRGVLEVDRDKQIISCPYCGSKTLIQESDEVTLARIRKEAAKERREFEEKIRLRKMAENEKAEKAIWRGIKKLYIWLAVIAAILMFGDKFFW